MPIEYPEFDEQTLLEDTKRFRTGLIPRDYEKNPLAMEHGFGDLPFEVFDKSTWKERMQEQEAKKLTVPQLCDYYKLGVKNQGQTNYCFPANTRVTMGNGTRKKIGDVEVGDTVLTAECGMGKVTALSKRHTREPLYQLNVQGQILEPTGEHPVLTEHGYRPAKDLTVGTKVARVGLVDRPERWFVPIHSIQKIPFEGNVYNISVAGDESYVAEGVGVHNCWINAPVHAFEITRLIQGQSVGDGKPNVSLSPASVGAKIKNFKNVGGWGTEGLKYLIDHGVVPSANWPDTAISRQYDTEQNNGLRAKYRVTEWWILKPRNFAELATCLLCGYPVACGYNWWGHEVTAVALTMKGSEFGIVIDNSWGEGWGDKGRGTLFGQKAIPDDAVVPRVVVAS